MRCVFTRACGRRASRYRLAPLFASSSCSSIAAMLLGAPNPSIVVARRRDSARVATLRRRWGTRAGVRLPPDRRRKKRTDEPVGGTPLRPARRSRGGNHMKRYLLLFAVASAALAVVLPATAGAATFRGAIVAKDAARKALVTAGTDGTVRTVRLHARLSKFRVGSTVLVSGAKLPDGTYSGATVRRLGKTRAAHVRGSVVRQFGKQLVISAGGSVFALRLASKRFADAGGLKP